MTLFYEEYGRYILTARFRDGHWTGYTTIPNDEIEEIIDKKIHGGLTEKTSIYVPSTLQSGDRYQSQVGFNTGHPGDCNVSPDGTVTEGFAENDDIWDKEAVFAHLKYVINTAEFLHEESRRERTRGW